MQQIFNFSQKPQRIILGLMSGTSCDGLDLACISVSGSELQTKFETLYCQTFPYSAEQKQFLLQLLHSKKTSAKEFSQLNFYLAQIWAEMIHLFLTENQLVKQEIDLIGSHGQTIWHEPQQSTFVDRSVSSTFQLGDPSVLAQLTGIPVVGDFRVADVALGGQGAPLIPYFDWLYFSKFKQTILSVNIGGISNLTLVPSEGSIDEVMAFDCGPGNMLIDFATRQFFNQAYDANGAIARSGKPNSGFFKVIKQADTFRELAPPKSTGRELYGQDYLTNILQKADKLQLNKADILYNLTDYTAFSIYDNYRRFIQKTQQAQIVVIGGGGVHNNFLMERLMHYFAPVEVKPVQEFGIDQDFKEAIGFAILANETIHGIGSNVPVSTGASRRAVLGKICLV